MSATVSETNARRGRQVTLGKSGDRSPHSRESLQAKLLRASLSFRACCFFWEQVARFVNGFISVSQVKHDCANDEEDD